MCRILSIILFFVGMLSCKDNKLKVYFPDQSEQVSFAIQKLNSEEEQLKEFKVKIIRFELDSFLTEQAFRISLNKRQIHIQAADETGLMYGGLELAEMLETNQFGALQNGTVEQKPYIKQRGLKFNIPLDIRTPSYQDAGDAAQNNILEMWNMDFWKRYLDMMARNRYNVLTLWNPHPFPSMIRNEKYPDIALENVCGTSFPLDVDRADEPIAKFIAGSGISKDVLDNLVVLKKMTMDEKIRFWRDVMKYAKARGVEVYFITWNIWMNSIAPPGWYRGQENKKGDEGKYGINNDQDNPKTIAYLREAVKDFILTYPDLAGIGVTAGENMEDRDDQYDREKWLWATYGEGVLDAKKIQSTRQVKFIHRYWQSGLGILVDDFISKYPDEINLSFKYARARMYATPKPEWANEYINEYSAFGLKSWWNIRNDDIFNFRWGNPEYAAEFMKNLPEEELTAGYFMGSDGYVWGREFTSKHHKEPRELEIDKHWYNFMLWGRMGYNPNLPEVRIKGLLKLHYPHANVDKLYNVWAKASDIPSLVTNFHWNSWDFQWAVEGCLDLRNGFHTVERFITNPTREGSGILSIPEFVELQLAKKKTLAITPFQVADSLDAMANEILYFVSGQTESDDDSYNELVYDLKAWAYMGKYYACKIYGAYYLYAFRSGLGDDNKQQAKQALEQALLMWKEYAEAASCNYYPQFMAKTRIIDWMVLTKNVANDIQLVKNME